MARKTLGDRPVMVSFRLSDAEYQHTLALAEKYCAGCVSEFLRLAIANYKKTLDNDAKPKKTKK